MGEEGGGRNPEGAGEPGMCPEGVPGMCPKGGGARRMVALITHYLK